MAGNGFCFGNRSHGRFVAAKQDTKHFSYRQIENVNKASEKMRPNKKKYKNTFERVRNNGATPRGRVKYNANET